MAFKKGRYRFLIICYRYNNRHLLIKQVIYKIMKVM